MMSGEMLSSSPAPQPGDILFAQKASSCVKAAGMDPRQMDLKRFYELAAVIITRAYGGIYKESLVGIISDPQNDDDLVNNAHKVINGLISKTNDRSLMEISGRDVVSGSQKAVGILVSVLYSEGNRLWLQKLNKADDCQTETSEDDDNYRDYGSNRKKNTVSSVKRDKRGPTRRCPYTETAAEISSFDEQLDKIISCDGDSDSNSDRDSHGYRNDYNAISQMGGSRKKRPSSAPSRSKSGHRGRIALAQAAAVERLFSAGKYRDILINRLADRSAAKPPPATRQESDRNSQPFTYDMKSGRKVILSQAYLDSVARQRKIEALNNVKKMSDIDGEKKYSENGLPPVPSRPEWPGKSTGASVDKWIKRMTASSPEEDSALSRPQIYGAYQLMEKLDMVFSVEHCFNCAHHSLSLRHDPKEYMRNANEWLRAVAQLAHECGVCARVGVTRMRARITTKCKHTDADSRIGALEVQVAFKDSKGVVLSEILHSKLQSRHWPSKASIEKKLKAFLVQSRIPVHPPQDPDPCAPGLGTDGIGSYPVGFVQWEETPVADTLWMFPATRSVGTVELNCKFEKVESPESKSLNIQWVFDARSVPGTAQAPPVVHEPLPPVPSAPNNARPRRPQSAATAKPISSHKAAETLARLNAKSPYSSGTEESKLAASSPRGPLDLGKLGSNDGSQAETVLNLLKTMASKNAPNGGENEQLLPYDIGVLVKRGVIVAETISCCVLLRQSVVGVCVAQMEGSQARSSSGSGALDSMEGCMASVFQTLDQRGIGALCIKDIDSLLTHLQNRRCSDQALRLVMLSIDTTGSGEISFRQFFSFICRHDESKAASIAKIYLEDVDKEESEYTDELGVLWMQIAMHLHGTEPAAMQKILKELDACGGIVAGVSSEDREGGGLCALQLFCAVLQGNGLMSCLHADSISYLQSAFRERECTSPVLIRAHDFATWLLAEGVDLTEREGTPMISPLISPVGRKAVVSLINEDDSVNFNETMPDLHTFYPTTCPEATAFEDREIEFSDIVVEGTALSEKAFEYLQVTVHIGGGAYVASASSAKERGTTRRSFKVDWKAVHIAAETFRKRGEMTVSLSSSAEGNANVLANGSAQLFNFMVPIGASFAVPLLVKSDPDMTGTTLEVKVTLSGTSREASEAIAKRISEMKPLDLVKVQFEPLPLDDLDLDASAPSSPSSSSGPRGKTKKGGAEGGDIEESIDLCIMGETDHHYMNDDFEDAPMSQTPPSEIDSRESSPDGKKLNPNSLLTVPPNGHQPPPGSIYPSQPSPNGLTENPMNNAPKREKDLPHSEQKKEIHLIENRINNKQTGKPVPVEAESAIFHSIGTTQADEDEEDEYEVDFEDFVED